MPIYRKETIQTYIDKLELFYQELHKALEGTTPDPANAELYLQHPNTFEKDFTQIDTFEVERSIQHFKVEVDCLKQLKDKTRQVSRVNRR